MAYGDIDLLKLTIAALEKKAIDNWAIAVGYQPGKVILAVAARTSPGQKVSGVDFPIPVDQIDGLIEKLKTAKANAQRKPQ